MDRPFNSPSRKAPPRTVTSSVASASAVGLSTGTAADILTLALPVGTWNVSAIAKGKTGAGTTIQWVRASISQTSATYDDTRSFSNESAQTTTNVGAPAFGIPPTLITVTVPTTLYLTIQAGFGVSTLGGYGSMTATEVLTN